jgi:hypothetical protein
LMSTATDTRPKDPSTATSATLSGLKELLWKVKTILFTIYQTKTYARRYLN